MAKFFKHSRKLIQRLLDSNTPSIEDEKFYIEYINIDSIKSIQGPIKGIQDAPELWEVLITFIGEEERHQDVWEDQEEEEGVDIGEDILDENGNRYFESHEGLGHYVFITQEEAQTFIDKLIEG